MCTADAGLRLKTQLVHAVEQFRDAAAPLLQALSYEQRSAIGSDEG